MSTGSVVVVDAGVISFAVAVGVKGVVDAVDVVVRVIVYPTTRQPRSCFSSDSRGTIAIVKKSAVDMTITFVFGEVRIVSKGRTNVDVDRRAIPNVASASIHRG